MPTSYSAQKDPSASLARGLGDPAGYAFLISPSDADDLAVYCRALRVHVPASLQEATLRVTGALARDDADTLTLRFAGPGTYYEPLSVRKVFATGTSAGLELHGYAD